MMLSYISVDFFVCLCAKACPNESFEPGVYSVITIVNDLAANGGASKIILTFIKGWPPPRSVGCYSSLVLHFMEIILAFVLV